MTTIRLTAAQAMVKWLSVQMTSDGNRFIEGVWAIFGHGNVAGLGEALYAHRDVLPTWRGHNEQTMAHTAIAYAKATGGATDRIVLVGLEEMSYRDVSEILGVPVGTIMSRLSRAREQMRQLLEDRGHIGLRRVK